MAVRDAQARAWRPCLRETLASLFRINAIISRCEYD